jgi:hypothetical protein
MKEFIVTIVVFTILFSCTSAETDKGMNKSSDTDKVTNEVIGDFKAIDTDEALVATALMAAPEASRENAKVIGYNMAGEFVTLKEGDGEFICLADDPKKDGFNAAAYHKNLDEFMARGRALKAEGKSAQEIFDIREKEAEVGKLDMGGTGSTLHIYYGPDAKYDSETSKVPGAIYRYVVYMPWATAESTGLPERPIAPNHPWIMNPGTHRAHIMISPINESPD